MGVIAEKLPRWLYRDRYTAVCWALFLITVLMRWRAYIQSHEAIYLLGSHRIFDPEFLGRDFTWVGLPPTTFAFDHLLAPLWWVLGEFGIVNLGRLAVWILFVGSLTALVRVLRLPPWSVIVGFASFMLWRQTLMNCGSPLEGFQPKSFAYPCIFFSLAWAMRGQVVRAGVAAGIGTLFHIIVGGWSCLALCCTMLVERRRFTWRQVVTFVLATVPFILPLVLSIALFHTGGDSAEQAEMDRIYVTFSQPHCCDPSFFMSPTRYVRIFTVLTLAPVLIFLWPERPQARILGVYIVILIAIFLAGFAAGWFDLFTLLKLYPFQLANSLPALFLFIFVLAYFGPARPRSRFGRVAWILAIVVSIWLLDQTDSLDENLIEIPGNMELQVLRAPEQGRFGEKIDRDRFATFLWIREQTPEDAIFITPLLADFWTYAERAQVASLRHPPHDRRLIEWKERLEALNGFHAFEERGFDIAEELAKNEGRLSIGQLTRIRNRYGATHYVATQPRPDLRRFEVFSAGRYGVYDIRELATPSAPPAYR